MLRALETKKRKEIDEERIKFILYPQLSYFNGLFKSGNLTEKLSSVNSSSQLSQYSSIIHCFTMISLLWSFSNFLSITLMTSFSFWPSKIIIWRIPFLSDNITLLNFFLQIYVCSIEIVKR
jgi:hypothetical protein